MAKKGKRLGKKVAVLLIGLVGVLQLGFWYLAGEESKVDEPASMIDTAVAGIKDPRKRLQRRVVMSVEQFRKKQGRLPTRLEELIPEWFDKIPVDPQSDKPFAYLINGQRFSVGEVVKDSGKTGDTDKSEFSEAQKDALIASLNESGPDGEYRYDATGRRDPFTPIDFSVKVSVDTTVPPLQRFTLGQLKLSAILRGGGEPSAMVETQEGMGYPVKRGTKIGLDNGEVVEILENKIVIRETQSDFSGAVTERLVEMSLRAGDEKGGFSRPTVRSKDG